MGTEQQPQPLLPPLARAALYLLACVLAFCFGAAIGATPVAVWLFAQRGGAFDLQHLSVLERSVLFTSIATGVYLPLIGVTVLFTALVDRCPLSHFGLRREGWKRMLSLGCLWAVAFVAIMFGFYAVTGWARFIPVVDAPWGIWLLLTVWIYPLVGFTEELVFRGYLLSVLDEWRGRRVAIIITSLLFWLMHLGQGNVHEPLGIIAMLTVGLTFALARYVTGSLWFPIGLHAAYDWLAISLGGDPGLGMVSLFRFEPQVPEWLIGPPGHVGVLDLAFELLLLLSVVTVLPKLVKKLSQNGDAAQTPFPPNNP